MGLRGGTAGGVLSGEGCVGGGKRELTSHSDSSRSGLLMARAPLVRLRFPMAVPHPPPGSTPGLAPATSSPTLWSSSEPSGPSMMRRSDASGDGSTRCGAWAWV